MNENISIFDLLPEDDEMRVKFQPIKSNDWKWTMENDYPKEKNGLKVFSCFACGGGSTMGYKLAGCDVIGCCEIDPKMNKVYVENHNPKYNFLMDIRKFNKIPNDELPQELFDLDILDGSPPCTTFSMAGEREDSWGKKKKFREGQAEQTLDDLSFVFIDTVAKLRPKVVIMENVASIFSGNAIQYCQKIYSMLKKIGYKTTHTIAKAENMGVPQERHRAIFISTREDFDFENLDLSFNYEKIPFCKMTNGERDLRKGRMSDIAKQSIRGESHLSDVLKRIENKYSLFTHRVIDEDEVVPTILAGHKDIWLRDGNGLSKGDIISSQTFPQDFNFINNTYGNVEYICGMSVPPIMIKRIVNRLIESGIFEK